LLAHGTLNSLWNCCSTTAFAAPYLLTPKPEQTVADVVSMRFVQKVDTGLFVSAKRPSQDGY
jgi:hypothetical protein